ncbi:MAG: ROK family transcriptional regulator [Acidobacteria bacterium]|nr:ROK family transcriptional regulator [Acidobacteriota bacterium]
MIGTPLRHGVLRPAEVRRHNSAAVLRLLRRANTMSRAELARTSGLSDGTMSRIIAELLEQDLVIEVGEENSTGGRPSTRLQLSDNLRSIGVEIQNWETRFAVATMRGALVDTVVVRTPATPEATLHLITEQVQLFQRSHQRLQGIGVTVRGIVNRQTGIVEIGNDPGWDHIALQQLLEASTGLPVWAENDVRAATIAEYHYTNAGEHAPQCLLYVSVNEGVGVGIVLYGQEYAGPSMSAGEFGQMVIADDGTNTRQDRPGCLEKLVANSAICDRYALIQGKAPGKWTDSAARVRRICQRALTGDRPAAQVVREAARYLGIGIASMVFGLDPQVIVLNATLNAAWPILLEEISAQFPDKSQWPTFGKLSLRQSAFGGQGCLIGAATLGFGPLFNSAAANDGRPS